MTEKSRRIQRVEKELREIISTYLVQEQAGSSENLVTLTQVVVSPDLRQARAFVCILGAEEVDKETLSDLQSHAPEIQKVTSKQLRMKFCPKIQFYNDDSVRLMAKLDSHRKQDSTEE